MKKGKQGKKKYKMYSLRRKQAVGNLMVESCFVLKEIRRRE